jgi:hypothetical protein
MAKKQRKAAEVTIDINANVASLAKDMKKVTGELDALSRKVSQTNSTLKGLFTIEAGRSAISVFQTIATTIGQIAEKGDRAQSVIDAFNRLGGNQQQIRAASEAVLGMVSAYDLMNIANEAMLRSTPGVMENFGLIADLGARLATTLNTDTKGGIEAVVSALDSAKASQLKGIGITVDAAKAYEEYGQAVGRAADKLTEAQQKEAIQIASIKQLQTTLGKVPPTADSVANAFAGLRTSLADALSDFARAINENEALRDALREIGAVVDDIDFYEFGKSVSFAVTEVVKLGIAIKDAIPFDVINRLVLIIRHFETFAQALEVAALQSDLFEKKLVRLSYIAAKKTDLSNILGIPILGSEARLQQSDQRIAGVEKEIEGIQSKIGIAVLRMAGNAVMESLNSKGGGLLGVILPEPKKGGDGGGLGTGTPGGGGGGIDEYTRKVEQLNRRLDETEKSRAFKNLERDIDNALAVEDYDLYERLRDELASAVRDGFVAEWTEGIALNAEQLERVMKAAEFEVQDRLERLDAKRRQQEQETADRIKREWDQTGQAAARSIDDIGQRFGVQLGGLFDSIERFTEGGIGGIFQEIGDQFGVTAKEAEATIAAAMTTLNAALSAKSIDKESKSNRGTGGAIGAGAGAGIGYVLGGPGGAAIGAQIGNIVGQEIGALFKWGAQNASTQARHAFANWLEEQLSQLQAVTLMDRNGRFVTTSGSAMNFIEGDSSRFNTPGWANEMDAWGANARNMFDGLGHALKGLLGITDKVGGQIAYLLGQNLAGNIDNARLLVYQLGLSIEDLSEALLKMALTGEITWQQYASFAAGLEEAFKPGLKAVNDMTGAMNEFYGSGGRGRAALKGFLDIIEEAIDGGAKTVDDLRAHLIKGGMSAEDADAFINVLKANGVKMLSEVKNMTDAQLGTIVAGLGNSIDAINKKWQEVGKTFEKMKWDLDNLPTEKDIKVRFSAEFDDNMNKADRAGLLDGNNSKLSPVDSSGVSVKSFGVSKSQQSGAVRTMSAGGGSVKSSNFTIAIDARNADVGVEDRIRTVITSYGDVIAQQAANIVMDNQSRGA